MPQLLFYFKMHHFKTIQSYEKKTKTKPMISAPFLVFFFFYSCVHARTCVYMRTGHLTGRHTMLTNGWGHQPARSYACIPSFSFKLSLCGRIGKWAQSPAPCKMTGHLSYMPTLTYNYGRAWHSRRSCYPKAPLQFAA